MADVSTTAALLAAAGGAPRAAAAGCHAKLQLEFRTELPSSWLTNQVAFTAGNPRVEHITGVVHLYRAVPADSAAQPSGSDAAAPAAQARYLVSEHSCIGRHPWYCRMLPLQQDVAILQQYDEERRSQSNCEYCVRRRSSAGTGWRCWPSRRTWASPTSAPSSGATCARCVL